MHKIVQRQRSDARTCAGNLNSILPDVEFQRLLFKLFLARKLHFA